MSEEGEDREEVLEYECPECGATFKEGEANCPDCGLEFDWSEELEYLCPECGTLVDPDSAQCPGCAAKFSKEENGDVLIEYEHQPSEEPSSVEEMLDAAIDEVMVHPVEKVSFGRTLIAQPAMEEPVKEGPKPPTKTVKATKTVEEQDVITGDVRYEEPNLYPGGFTTIGIIFVIAAIAAGMGDSEKKTKPSRRGRSSG